MSREEAKKLYEGKHFYEIKDAGEDGQLLVGPFDNIYYTSEHHPEGHKYKFLQVINGTPVQAFTKEEILVTKQKIEILP